MLFKDFLGLMEQWHEEYEKNKIPQFNEQPYGDWTYRDMSRTMPDNRQQSVTITMRNSNGS